MDKDEIKTYGDSLMLHEKIRLECLLTEKKIIETRLEEQLARNEHLKRLRQFDEDNLMSHNSKLDMIIGLIQRQNELLAEISVKINPYFSSTSSPLVQKDFRLSDPMPPVTVTGSVGTGGTTPNPAITPDG